MRRRVDVVEIALALLDAQASFDDVGVRGFAGVLALGGDVEEVVGFVERALGDEKFLVRGAACVVEADDGLDEAAAGDFELGCSAGGVGVGEADGGELGEAEVFGNGCLAVVLVHGVVGDEDGQRLIEAALRGGGCSLVGLSEEILIVVDGRRQQTGACVLALELRGAAFGFGSGEGGLVSLREANRFIQSDRLGWRRCLRSLRLAEARDAREKQSDAEDAAERSHKGRV